MIGIVQFRTNRGVREARWGGSTVWRIIDEATGLPVVRLGQFWRVSPPRSKDDHYLRIELHQNNPAKKTWWGTTKDQPSSVVGQSVANVDDVDFGPDSVLASALYILRGVETGETKDQLINDLVGDYPPKRLKE